jgi:hypothetical protein
MAWRYAMPLYEVRDDRLAELPIEKFATLSMYERQDLQRLLRNDITPLGDDLLVVAEEFGQWEDARRRIDLLAVDTAGRLVVIELKRTEAGGHMDLQAIRYAAMVSTMSFDDVVAAYREFLAKYQPGEEAAAQDKLESFLAVDRDSDEEPTVSTRVRVILVSANFGREITTTILWLNSFEGMDIECFRLIPYELDGRVVLDVKQVIPLPEAEDYQIRIRRKEAARERALSRAADGRDLTKYHIVIDGVELPAAPKRQAVRIMVEHLVAKGVPIRAIHEVMPERGMRRLPGQLRDEESVANALASVVASAGQVRRHFTEQPLIDEANDETYVIYKMWGRSTEQVLNDLVQAFPNAGVSFRPADA